MQAGSPLTVCSFPPKRLLPLDSYEVGVLSREERQTVRVSHLTATGIMGAIVLCVVADDPTLGFTQECLGDLCPAWGMYSLADLL